MHRGGTRAVCSPRPSAAVCGPPMPAVADPTKIFHYDLPFSNAAFVWRREVAHRAHCGTLLHGQFRSEHFDSAMRAGTKSLSTFCARLSLGGQLFRGLPTDPPFAANGCEAGQQATEFITAQGLRSSRGVDVDLLSCSCPHPNGTHLLLCSLPHPNESYPQTNHASSSTVATHPPTHTK